MSKLYGWSDPAARRVLEQVYDERHAQDEKWGEQNHPDGTGDDIYRMLRRNAIALTETHAAEDTLTWTDIMREEVYEAFAESDPEKLRAELVQVAAVAVAWIECIDRRSQ